MSKEEIDDRIRKKEWWMTGAEAVKLGFADGLIK
jgi:ATP-dependent protease ClpP protease subunit